MQQYVQINTHTLKILYILIFSQVLRTQQLMRALKTMNTLSEIKREDVIGLNLNDITQHHRRPGRILDKVY